MPASAHLMACPAQTQYVDLLPHCTPYKQSLRCIFQTQVACTCVIDTLCALLLCRVSRAKQCARWTLPLLGYAASCSLPAACCCSALTVSMCCITAVACLPVEC